MTRPRILIVEDNSILQKVMQLLSSRCNVEADIVGCGRDALEALASEKGYQMIFMDRRMPIMDGLECTRHIREREKKTGKHIPIVAMTASSFDDEKQACFDVGMDDYLSKPFTNDEFNEALSRWLSVESCMHETQRTR